MADTFSNTKYPEEGRGRHLCKTNVPTYKTKYHLNIFLYTYRAFLGFTENLFFYHYSIFYIYNHIYKKPRLKLTTLQVGNFFTKIFYP